MTDNNPLLQLWRNFAEANGNTRENFTTFVDQQLSGTLGRVNVDVPGSTATALYSGEVNGRFAFRIAQDLAERSGDELRIIDNTNIGRLLGSVLDRNADPEIRAFDIDRAYTDARFEAASAKFALETRGPVITITPEAQEFRADKSRVTYTAVEVDNIIKSGATTINGRDLSEINAIADQIDDPVAKRAYVKATLDGDFARIIAQGTDNKLRISPDSSSIDFDADTKARLGIGNIDFDPPNGTLFSPQFVLTESLKDSAARGLAAENIFLKYLDDRSKTADALEGKVRIIDNINIEIQCPLGRAA